MKRFPFSRQAVPHSQRYPLRESTDIGAKKKRKETLDTAEILGRKSMLYNRILTASLPKKSQWHCIEVLWHRIKRSPCI